ncbi:MAG: hypothetical protein J5965_10135 [Aeriscardovia sp.]|nr:hypothetical protein [Aeriscardovia sp.]
MKKFMVCIAIVAAFVAGWFVKGFTPEWDYQRGIDRMEVRADYELSIGGDTAYYEMLLWDEEYKNYEIVERGFVHRTDLEDLCGTAKVYQDVFAAGYHR